MLAENPVSQFFSASCYSNHVILIPPEKHLLLHVTSDGFQEWEQGTGMWKPIYLPSGARLTLDVQLEPVRPQGEAAPGTERGIVGDVPGGPPLDGASPTTGILLSSEPRSTRVASPTWRASSLARVNVNSLPLRLAEEPPCRCLRRLCI
jgi:hypothetical protein